jgi:hypothetical protein
VRAFAIVSVLAPEEAVELFLREEEALAAVQAAILDVPGWEGVLRVEAVDLRETQPRRTRRITQRNSVKHETALAEHV